MDQPFCWVVWYGIRDGGAVVRIEDMDIPIVWTEHLFNYCERGQNAAFWAEPFNALSNAGFVIVALAAGVAWARQAATHRGTPEAALVALVGCIGVGSFLFHTLATRWSQLADVGPIALFMFAYAAYAQRRFLGLSWIATWAGLIAFAVLTGIAFRWPCPVALRGLVAGPGCLNGSITYIPALAMLVGASTLTALKRHPASATLCAAAAVFTLSLIARTVDFEVCASSRALGQMRGTHAIWHLLNAATLALLLDAALRGWPVSRGS